jgi:taurine dioxygenase
VSPACRLGEIEKDQSDMSIRVTPIEGSNRVGCQVHGVTSQLLDDPAARDELMRVWIEHGLIVFRGITGADLQIKLSGVFGEPEAHPEARGNNASGHKEIVQISYNPSDADIVEVEGVALGGWLPWHMDLIYLDKVSRGSILRPVVMPDQGGNTGFIDKIQLYEKLTSDMKAKLEGLSVVYWMDIDFANLKFARPPSLKILSYSKLFSGLRERRDGFPRVEHPLVYRQKETGRPVLNFSPYFAQEISGLPVEESNEILHALGDLCLDDSNAYYHQWRADDMVLWDNWRMLHRASGVPVNSRRIMERTQIIGDYGLGRMASDRGAIRDEMRVTV